MTRIFQNDVDAWMVECFGSEAVFDQVERNHRFLEEALELVQACDCTADEAHQLVDYVYGRPTGEVEQEVGGVMVTLSALCTAQDIGLMESAEIEMNRVWLDIGTIRAKQTRKPQLGPLPEGDS